MEPEPMHRAKRAGGVKGPKDQVISSRRLGQTWETLKEPKQRMTSLQNDRSFGLRLMHSLKKFPNLKYSPESSSTHEDHVSGAAAQNTGSKSNKSFQNCNS